MTTTTPTVILVSSVLLREGIASLLRGTPYKVVAAVGRPTELTDLDVMKQGRALAIVGIDSVNGSLDQAAESVRRLRSLIPDSKIVLVADAHGPVDLQGVLALVPDGYILDLGSRETLVKSLELIFMDQQIFVLGRPITTAPLQPSDIPPPERAVDSQFLGSYRIGRPNHLSPRECQVLIRLAHGDSNKQIARVCHISDSTVKVHLKAILRKTNTRNRTEAALWAIEHGLRDSTSARIAGRVNP
jgi:two-component system, NarL family, nitrate/nitrite response regulator NarL